MADKIQCETHGECVQTFVCTHLLGESAGLGFNRNEPDEENPFPDAWCDNCEIIRVAHDGWDEESEKLAEIVMILQQPQMVRILGLQQLKFAQPAQATTNERPMPVPAGPFVVKNGSQIRAMPRSPYAAFSASLPGSFAASTSAFSILGG